ncbi:hypothetical protein B0H11DRAFT_2194129 [Mycena galericulata]|nr:hypothetical protein B0H11DRAFT_2194129 [Mycena galericulata]
MMKAIASCVLFASLLVRALPSPDSPVTLLAAQIDPDCAQNECPIVSISVLGVAGSQTTYELLGFAASTDSEDTNFFFDPSPTETLIEGPEGYTLMHVNPTVLPDPMATRLLTVEDDCTFVGTSAVNCMQHYDTLVSTITGAPLKAIATVNPGDGGPSTSGSAPTHTSSSGGVRAGAGMGCMLIIVATIAVTLSRI